MQKTCNEFGYCCCEPVCLYNQKVSWFSFNHLARKSLFLDNAVDIAITTLPDRTGFDGSAGVELIEFSSLTEELNASWDNLAADACFDNPFYERWNLTSALTHLATEPVKLLLVWSAQGRLDALIPVVHDKGELPGLSHLSLWLHDYAYLGMPLIRAGELESVLDLCAQWLNRSQYSALVFPQCYRNKVEAVSEKKAGVVIDNFFERASLNVLQYEGEFSHPSKKKAKEYRRQLRRLQEQGYEWRQLEPQDTHSQVANLFLTLEASGWKGREKTALLSDEGDEAYLRQIVERGMSQNRLGLYYLGKLSVQNPESCISGQTVAILLTFRTGKSELLYKTGFDESFAKLSPGVLNVIAYSQLLVQDKAVEFCDSGAMPDHPMINKVWQNRVELCQLTIIKQRFLELQLLRARTLYRKLKNSIKKA